MYKTTERKRANEKLWREKNKEKLKVIWRNRGKQNRLKNKQTRVLKRYGLTMEQVNAMFIAQNDRCYICDKHKSEFKKGLMIDHCHKTNKVRKLLCPNCNSGIGHFFDDVTIMENAIVYIKETDH